MIKKGKNRLAILSLNITLYIFWIYVYILLALQISQHTPTKPEATL